MLEDERKKRMELAADFQTRMSDVTNEINQQKEVRQKEFEENQAIRKRIQDAIS